MGEFIEQFGTVYWIFVVFDIFLIFLCVASYEEQKAKDLGYKSVGDMGTVSFLLALIPFVNIVLSAIILNRIIMFNKENE